MFLVGSFGIRYFYPGPFHNLYIHNNLGKSIKHKETMDLVVTSLPLRSVKTSSSKVSNSLACLVYFFALFLVMMGDDCWQARSLCMPCNAWLEHGHLPHNTQAEENCSEALKLCWWNSLYSTCGRRLKPSQFLCLNYTIMRVQNT